MLPIDPVRPLLRPAFGAALPRPRHGPHDCHEGRHLPIASSKAEINDVTHAECRHCGCRLMRMSGSRRWFRCGEMGA